MRKVLEVVKEELSPESEERERIKVQSRRQGRGADIHAYVTRRSLTSQPSTTGMDRSDTGKTRELKQREIRLAAKKQGFSALSPAAPCSSRQLHQDSSPPGRFHNHGKRQRKQTPSKSNFTQLFTCSPRDHNPSYAQNNVK